MATAIVGKRYKHYKGREYIVIAIAQHSETHEELVIYEGQNKDSEFGSKSIWARPRVMFEEKIDINGQIVDRFKVIE